MGAIATGEWRFLNDDIVAPGIPARVSRTARKEA